MRPSILVLALACAGLACGGAGAAADIAAPPDPGGDETSADAGDRDVAPAEAEEGPGAGCPAEWAGAPHETFADGTFFRGPYVQSVFADRATIVWQTQRTPPPPEGCVAYQVQGESRSACAAPDATGVFRVAIEGLPPGTAVPYVATAGAASTQTLVFRTAPAGDGPARILVFADNHGSIAVGARIAEAALLDGVDLAVAVGDMVGAPDRWQFDLFLAIWRPLMHRVPLWPVIGNHERLADEYFRSFVVPGAASWGTGGSYYEVRWGGVWMGMLELTEFLVAAAVGKDTPEVAWLKERLASPEATGARWRLLFVHEPPWAAGWGHCVGEGDSEGYAGETALRQVLLPIAVEAGVHAIFSGHVHGYERGESGGVLLVTAGGAGGGLDHLCPRPADLPEPWLSEYRHHRVTVDALCDRLVVEARDLDGELIDRVERLASP